MRVAGFVLAGGQSRRMGTNKALLPWREATLIEHVAGQVRDAAGTVTLVGGCPEMGHLAFPCLPDRYPDCGPLGGLVTALESTDCEWILLAACDLPYASAETFKQLLYVAERAIRPLQAVVPRHPNGHVEPLSALYHRSCLLPAKKALQLLEFKMVKLLKEIDLFDWPIVDPAPFLNTNTAEDWSSVRGAHV